MMTIKIGKVIIFPGFLLFFTLFLYFCPTWLIICSLLSAIIHEFGHTIVLNYLGVPIQKFEFSMFGIAILSEIQNISYKNEFFAALAGPALSLISAVILSIIGKLYLEQAYIASGVNFIYGMFNLLPIRPLDGGKILNAVLNIKIEHDTAERIMFICETSFIAALLLLGIMLFLYSGFNPTFFILSLWLTFYYCKPYRNSVKF